jgi:hypothetical protein
VRNKYVGASAAGAFRRRIIKSIITALYTFSFNEGISKMGNGMQMILLVSIILNNSLIFNLLKICGFFTYHQG